MRHRFRVFGVIDIVTLVAALMVSATSASGLVPPVAGDSVGRTPVVVVLHSYHNGYPWTDNISVGIREVFVGRDEPVQLRLEFLDARRIVSDEYFEDLRRLLATKYSGIEIDVVICADDQAMHFLLGAGAEIFRGVPAVVCSASSFEPAIREVRPITGVEDSFDIEATLDMATDLHPGVHEVVVVTDVSRTGLALRDRAKSVLGSQRDGLLFRYLEDLTMDELVSETATLEDGSLIFFLTFSRDQAGDVYSHEVGLRRIRQVSKVPIYAVWESFFGHGIVGGKIHSGREEGRIVAEMADRIIRGEDASDIPLTSSPSRFRFDWRELDRFGIGEDQLPEGSLVSERPFSLYRQYKGMFWTIGATIAILVTLVVFLVLNTLRRRRAEAVQARFAAILASTSDFVATATPMGGITYLNAAGRRLIGWDADEPLDGKRIRDVQPRWVIDLIREKAGPEATENGVWEGETAIVTRDDVEIPVSQVILSHRNKGGEIAFFSTIIRDLRQRIETEETLRAIEEHLQHSRKMEAIGQLAGGVAHDFNNLLTGIMGNADLLTVLLPKGSREADRAQDILAASEKAAAVTRQLLMFSRKGSFKTNAVDLRTMVDGVIGLLSRSIDRRIEIERLFTEDRTVVMGDASQIENAILNLAVNARDAMPEGGLLEFMIGTVRLDEDAMAVRSKELVAGDYVEVVVSDTGVGIPGRLHTKIFEPFFTTKGPGKGTGLGLATAYGCARNHNGTINVASEPGCGSRFTIMFPVSENVVVEEEPTTKMADAPVSEGRILVVDDEKVVRDIVAESLGSLGYIVTVCEDGHEAVDVYRREGGDIDLVILDLIMPRMNGSDTFSALKAIDPGIRVMLSSGYSANQEVEDLLDNGACGFLVKPFTLTDLAEEVHRILNLEPQ